MKKSNGLGQQQRGKKRRAKVVARKHKHTSNLEYIVKLMGKYGKDVKLNEPAPAGTKYMNEYLNDRGQKADA